MKTTLVLDDALVEQVRGRARARAVTRSSVVEDALILMLATPPAVRTPVDLPTFNSGGYLVDISDRNALYEAMDGP